MGFLSGLSGGGDNLLDSILKMQHMDEQRADRQVQNSYRQAMLEKIARAEGQQQQATGILSGLPTVRRTEYNPNDMSAIQAEAESGGYAPPMSPSIYQNTPIPTHERYDMAAQRMEQAGLPQALGYRKEAETLRKDLVNKMVETNSKTLDRMMNTPGMPKERVQAFYNSLANHPLMGPYFVQGDVGNEEPGFPKQADEAHLTYTAKFDPDPTKREQAQSVLSAMQTRAIEKDTARRNAEKSQLTQGARRTEAVKYLVTGSMTGMRGTADKVAIMNDKDELMTELGLQPEEAMAIQTAYKADSAALSKIRQREAMTKQAEGQAQNNSKELLNKSAEYTRTGYPAPNKLVGWFAQNLGDKKQQAEFARYKIALNAFSREYMRVVTGGAMSVAELSVGAQQKADELLNSSDSWSTLEAKVKQAQIEMQNTMKSHDDELKSIQNRVQNPWGYITGDFTKKPPIQNGPSGNRIQNNPLNIKLGPATQKWVDTGAAAAGRSATDGGSFLNFSTPEGGLEAAKDLLFNNGRYGNLTVDAGMKKWSNGGYGGEIAPSLANKTISSLLPKERDQLVQAMAKREGNQLSSGAETKKTITLKSGKVIQVEG